jgi:hypothetical protein
MERFSFVTPVTGLNRPNTRKKDDDDEIYPCICRKIQESHKNLWLQYQPLGKMLERTLQIQRRPAKHCITFYPYISPTTVIYILKHLNSNSECMENIKPASKSSSFQEPVLRIMFKQATE